MFVDLGEVICRDKIKTNQQYFFSGNLIEIELGIVCFKVSCVTPADGLDLSLYVNTRMVMDYFLKKKPQSTDPAGQASTSADTNPRKNLLPMAEEDINQTEALNESTTKPTANKMDEEQLPTVVDVESKPKTATAIVAIE